MVPQLQASASSALGGTGSSDLNWNMTIPNLGKNGLIIISWLGKEEAGEENPEEINAVSFNGVGMTIIEANENQMGSGFAYLTGSQIPPAGTYACHLNFQDSPKQAEKKRGASAAFTNVKDQAPEAQQVSTGTTAPRSLNLTPLTSNALVVASWGWSNGYAETWGWGTKITASRGDGTAGASLAYAVIATPALQAISCNATDPGTNGMASASFAMQSVIKGQIL